MDRIIVRVDQVMRSPRMFRVVPEDLLRQRRSSHVRRKIAPLVRRAQDGQSVKQFGLIVLRVILV